MPAGYRPCSFLVVPKEFGRRGDAEWRVVTEDDEAKVAVAYLQHRVALAVRVALGKWARHGARTTFAASSMASSHSI